MVDEDSIGLNGGKQTAIIFPPPEVRNIVDKTASFVARNGPDFEHKIRQNEINNPKFNFLNINDPYHGYYQHKVKTIKDGDEQTSAVQTSQPTPSVQADTIKARQSEFLKQVQKEKEPPIPLEPPPDYEFSATPPTIASLDLNIVKLTAQFVARNGRQFLASLMNREQRNYQFDFLRPQHALFQYFTRLLEQYTKVLIPPRNLLEKLSMEGQDESITLDAVSYRVRWIKHQEFKKKREEQEVEKKRVAYAQIDWHNFVVVETVDYQPWEKGHFPPPTSREDVGARVLIQRRIDSEGPTVKQRGVIPEKKDEANTQVEDMEESEGSDMDEDDDDSSSEAEPTPPPAVVVPPPPPKPPTPQGGIELRAYDPKAPTTFNKKPVSDTGGPGEFLISPITGERIPADKVAEHMRIGLLDPRWLEERDKRIKGSATEQAIFAPGSDIDSSLKHLAERRTDIFGVGEEAAQETDIGKKMGQQEQRSVVLMGGLSEDEDVVSNSPTQPDETPEAPAVARTLLPLEAPQKSASSASSVVMAPPISHGPVPAPMGLLPPPPPLLMPPLLPSSPYMQAPIVLPSIETESAKRMRPSDERTGSQLIPPEVFMAHHGSGPVFFYIQAPDIESDSYNLKGQSISMVMSLEDTVAQLKSKIHSETGLPTGKQKLNIESVFFKDSNSLAFYNILPGMTIQLQVKERGGRKK